MRIAHFVPNFPGGKIESYGKSMAVYKLCISLANRGHDVTVFTISDDNQDHLEYINGVKVYRYSSLLQYRSERLSFKILYKPLVKNYDIIHLHSGISISLVAGYIYNIVKKKPLVITWHGDSVREYGRYSGLIPSIAAWLYKRSIADIILSKSDVIISPSKTYINGSPFLCKYKSKISVIPNGITISEFDISHSKNECKRMLGLESKFVVLFVGSLYPLKGPHILLEAIPKIIKYIDDIMFVFVGGGDVEFYQELSKENNVGEYVMFAGYISEDLKPMYYKSSDIFCLPSIASHEIFGIVNLEAMACGIPIVASRIGGVPDLVKNGKTGLLVQPRNSSELAEAITYLLMNKKIRNEMGANARENIYKYSWDEISASTEKLYEDLWKM